MNKRIAIIVLSFVLLSCSSTKSPLISGTKYDVLTGGDYGGASFQFYEIISDETEFNILLNDAIIKPFVKKDDIKTCNFILVNMGEKQKEGYALKVQKIEEFPDKISIIIKEIEPKGKTTQVSTKPCFVIKIKSKKPIEIK
jgi:hypothetical protein